MASKCNARIVRRENPTPTKRIKDYRRYRECLREDFGWRCAYCMIHENTHSDGRHGFDIDHFKPRAKDGPVDAYANLYWSCKWCNSLKHDHWPSEDDKAIDMRFADPCAEHDYGNHFTEEADGTLRVDSKCGGYHVGHLRLNRPMRVSLRVERNELIACVLKLVEMAKQHASTNGVDISPFAGVLSRAKTRLDHLPARIPARETAK